MADRVELLVVGGGLAGMTLAAACAGAGIATALVDREAAGAALDEAYDGRSTALAWGSRLILDGIGVWTKIEREAEPILEIRVADGGSPLFLHYDRAAIGAEALGFIVENRVLRRALRERLRETGVRVLARNAVREVRYGARAVAALADGAEIAAELVAAADGARSALRAAAGIAAVAWSYPQVGIVATVRHAEPHRGVAVEHFLPAGPFAILPMTGGRSSIVWTERAALAPALLALDDAAFARELGRRFGDHLGTLAVEGPRFSYPLSFLHAARYGGPRLALVGEAAHVLHPIAGQGFNLGIRDIALLAELIVDARRIGLDLGDSSLIRRYDGERRADALLLSAVTDGLNRLFSNDLAPVRLARDLGLAAVNRAPPLKRLFMRHAMGVAGALPRLARGERL
jgi:2-octaprenyl-6-methoxyphenol hydroxylase